MIHEPARLLVRSRPDASRHAIVAADWPDIIEPPTGAPRPGFARNRALALKLTQ
jgi:hypothetical protein